MTSTTHSAASPASSTADRELVITRVLDAPRELVFDAFLDARNIDRWWGPRGFRNATIAMSATVGGTWRYVMHGPDGTDYDDRVTYLEIVRPERIVYDHGSDVDNASDTFRVTLSFEREGAKTRLTMHTVFASAAMLEEARQFGAVEGGEQTLDRLEEFLAAPRMK